MVGAGVRLGRGGAVATGTVGAAIGTTGWLEVRGAVTRGAVASGALDAGEPAPAGAVPVVLGDGWGWPVWAVGAGASEGASSFTGA